MLGGSRLGVVFVMTKAFPMRRARTHRAIIGRGVVGPSIGKRLCRLQPLHERNGLDMETAEYPVFIAVSRGRWVDGGGGKVGCIRRSLATVRSVALEYESRWLRCSHARRRVGPDARGRASWDHARLAVCRPAGNEAAGGRRDRTSRLSAWVFLIGRGFDWLAKVNKRAWARILYRRELRVSSGYATRLG